MTISNGDGQEPTVVPLPLLDGPFGLPYPGFVVVPQPTPAEQPAPQDKPAPTEQPADE